jgi:hypothetical protein
MGAAISAYCAPGPLPGQQQKEGAFQKESFQEKRFKKKAFQKALTSENFGFHLRDFETLLLKRIT